MSITSPLFDKVGDVNVADCLNAMRLRILRFSKIHSRLLFPKQQPNAHEAYLPVNLACEGRPSVNADDLFRTDFSAAHGIYDESTGIHKPQIFVVYGAYGTGKSALLNYYKYQWILGVAEDVINIKEFDMVLLISGKDLSHLKPISVLSKKLDFTYIPGSMSGRQMRDEILASRILWMVDSFDDVTELAKEFIWKVTRKYNSQMIITSYLYHQQRISSLLDEHDVKYASLHLQPLSGDSWRSLVPKMITAITRDANIVQEATAGFTSYFETHFSQATDLFPFDVGTYLNMWMQNDYPQFFNVEEGELEHDSSGDGGASASL